MECSEMKKALLKSFYKNNRWNFTLAFFFSVMMVALDPLVSWVLGAVIDSVNTADWDALRLTGIRMIAFVLLLLGGNIAMSASKARFVHKALQQYKERAFQGLSQKSINTFTKENTGTYLSCLTNDAGSVENNYLNGAVLLVYFILMFCLTLGMMLWYSPLLTLIVLILSILPILISVVMGNGLARRERVMSDENEAFTTRLKDLLGGFAVIKSFKAENRTKELFCEENARLEAVKRKRAGFLNAAAGTSA